MKNKLVLLFVGALVFRLILAPLIWHPDVNNHIDWGIKFFEYGANKFYAPESNIWAYTWPNQPPGTILIFALIRKIYELVFSAFWFINTHIPAFPSGIITFLDEKFYAVLLKLPSILADLGIAYLIYVLGTSLKNKKAGYLGAILFLVNPVIWYNSAVWGQTDALINFFALLGFVLLTKRKLILATIAISICLFIKISLLIFLPIFLIYLIKQKYSTKEKLMAFLIPVFLIIVLTLPFTDSHEPISWLLNLYKEKVLTNQMQVITANAFNLWGALTGIYEQPHSLMFGPLSYQNWGNLLFVLAILPVSFVLWKRPTTVTAIWAFALVSFSSWMLLTNMHERYLYPMFPYFAILAAIHTKLLLLYVGVSIVNFINLYNLWWVPHFSLVETTLSIYNRSVPRVLSGVLTVFYFLFYRKFIKT